MAYVKYDPQKLYNATNGGLQIIKDYCQAAEKACDGEDQRLHFAFSHERTPSAHLFRGQDYWIVKDFSSCAETSSSGKVGSYDPIAVFCKDQGFDRHSQFAQVMQILYSRYGLSEEEVLTADKNTPIWDEPVPAPDDMQEGEYRWEGIRELNEEERRVMGRCVTKEILKELHWYSVERIGVKKNGMIRWEHATETFPILLRECIMYDEQGNQKGSFFKKYEPLNYDKGRRFLYLNCNGMKPKDYVNNIGEFNKEYARHKEAQQEDKGYEIPELLTQGVVLCCGERDALACRAMGWWPIWLNSETAELPDETIHRIRKFYRHCPIYYIPDLDPTGQEAMRKIANQHPDIWICELPESLKKKKDNRGKPMKDLRDWIESDRSMNRWKFSDFMAGARRVQFWEVLTSKNGDQRVKLDSECLHFFLRANGIEPIYNDDLKTVEFGRHLNQYMIESMDIKKINDFVMQWANERLLPRVVKNALLDGAKLDESKLTKMLSATYNFVCHTQKAQNIYFRDCMIIIDDNGVQKFEPKKAAESDVRVWKQSVIDRPFQFIQHTEKQVLKNKYGKPVLENGKEKMVDVLKRTKLFHYTRTFDEETQQWVLSIEIHPEAYKSAAFCVLCATSHIYWEDEQSVMEAKSMSREDIKAYWQKNWCKLDSPYLSSQKVYEQKASLISKLFIIGHYGWDFNCEARPWSAYIIDDYDGEGSNGGSGKSLLFQYISQYKEVQILNGRSQGNGKDKYLFASVTSRTSCVVFDDFIGKFSDWYEAISNGLRIERKGVDAFTLPVERSPKLAFTANGVFDKQSSSVRRMIRSTCSSFFHSEGNGYQETSSPNDYCGHLWGSDYTRDQWRYDDNIFLECIEEAMPFIKRGIKIEPPLERAMLRKLRREIGKANIEFFDDYFRAGETSHANKFVTREQFATDYKRNLAGRGDLVTEQALLEKCAMWCAYRPWVLGYCPQGVTGWTSDLKGEYRKSRIIQNSVEGIYVATLDNTDEKLEYLRKKLDKEALEELTNPALADVPL